MLGFNFVAMCPRPPTSTGRRVLGAWSTRDRLAIRGSMGPRRLRLAQPRRPPRASHAVSQNGWGADGRARRDLLRPGAAPRRPAGLAIRRARIRLKPPSERSRQFIFVIICLIRLAFVGAKLECHPWAKQGCQPPRHGIVAGRARLGWTVLSQRELQRIQVLGEVVSRVRTVGHRHRRTLHSRGGIGARTTGI